MLSRPSSEHYHGLRRDRGEYRQAAGDIAKAPTVAGAKRRGTDWSACMKNRHRVSQVVNKRICSRLFGCQLRMFT